MTNAGDDREKELVLEVYDPDNPPFERLCICDIIRELPELTDEDVSRYHDD